MVIFVYGSLRKGQYNHWGELAHLGTTTMKGYKMCSLGGYPYVLPSLEEDEITVDILEVVDKDTLTSIHNMELGAGYTAFETSVTYEGTNYDGLIYVHKYHKGQHEQVVGGDWCKFLKEEYAL